MALQDRDVQRVARQNVDRLDRILRDLRAMNQDFFSLGGDFRNDRRFSADAYRLRDEAAQTERDVQRTRERVRSIERSSR